MNIEKISQPLAEALQDAQSEDWVDVIVEIAGSAAPVSPGSSRAEKIAARKETFSRKAAPVANQIRRMGGEVTGQAWLNESIQARVPKKMVDALSDETQVARIDLPRRIQADVT